MSAAAALAALLALALPEGAARYRVELGGVTVGLAELELRCDRERCRARWETRLRLPEEAGGAVTTRRFETELDRAGRSVGRMRRTRDAETVRLKVPAGRVPAGLAEVLLASAAGRSAGACVEVFEEETLETGRACGEWEGDALEATVLGLRERVTFAADGFPETVALAEDGARFVRDWRAAVPSRPPRLTTRVAGPADPARASSFCGVPVDPPAPRPPPGLPAPRADGGSCREKTAAYLARAAAAGHEGRTVLGVAWDGTGFVWHAWAELLAEGTWVPVDPSFGELPARGPRFTVARHGAGRAAALAAGRRVLACWGRAGVLVR